MEVHLLGGYFPTVTMASYYRREPHLKYQTLLYAQSAKVQYLCGICTLCLSAMTARLNAPQKSWSISRSTDAMY